jgi:hypothetical protein
MSIRSFSGDCWIAGWFNPEENFKLMDVQQYDTKEGAIDTAKKLNPKCPAFIGILVNWDDLDLDENGNPKF